MFWPLFPLKENLAKKVKKEHLEDQEGLAHTEISVCVCTSSFYTLKLEGEMVPASFATHAFSTLIQRSKVTLLGADKVLLSHCQATQRCPSVYVWAEKLEEARGTEESTLVVKCLLKNEE